MARTPTPKRWRVYWKLGDERGTVSIHDIESHADRAVGEWNKRADAAPNEYKGRKFYCDVLIGQM